jgi:dienelactone hydrolase
VAKSHARLREAASAAETQRRPPTLAREDFLNESVVLDVELSPDGSNLAVLKRAKDRLEAKLVTLSNLRELGLMSSTADLGMTWAPDGTGLWLNDTHGVSWFDARAGRTSRIYRWPELRRQSFLGVDPNAPRHALLREDPEPGTAGEFKYWLLDPTGSVRLLLETKTALSGILLREGPAVAFTARIEDSSFDTVVFRHELTTQREIIRCRGLEVCRMLRATGDGERLWLMGQRGEDLLGLQSWHAADGRLITQHRDPHNRSDVDGVIWSKAGPVAVAYDDGRKIWEALDPAMRAPLRALQKQLPMAALGVSLSQDADTWLVRAEHERWSDARYYAYFPKTDEVRRLFTSDQSKALPDSHLATMEPLHYASSDGTTVQGYVMLPMGRSLARAPIVAWLHGGPVTREYARFDARLQLLTNRGYVVFVPNFRGSDGFGIGYKLAADGDVGDGRVLEDVLSGLDFLIGAGIGDRTKQAVMGHSFGGYLSLVAATHRPERFAVAFTAAPPTDYGWMKQWQAEHDLASARSGSVPLRVVFPLHRYPYLDTEWREKMREESPRQNIAKTRAPIYIWAGAKDDRVPLSSLGHYAGEMRRSGKTVAMLTDPDAGHSTNTRLGAEAYLYMMEVAAHRHLGGAVTARSEQLSAFLKRNTRLGAELLVPSDSP